MGSSRALSWLAASVPLLGCNALTGLGDLEKVDCVESCGSGGSGGDGGAAMPLTMQVGRKTSCAILTDESLWCWGANPGVEPGTVSTTPVRVSAIDATDSVVVGLDHVCAVDGSGTVWCWGRNDHGQLGDGTTQPSAVPKPVPGLPAIDTLSVGANHSCAFTSPEITPVEAFCWGRNDYGQLGDGNTTDSPVPLKLTFSDGAQVFRLAPGDSYTCAVVDLGGGTFEARCWGNNDKGQCGQDPVAMPVVSEPTAVPGLPAVERIYPGYEHCCARTVGTRVPYCWGANEHGQVGTNTTSPFEPASAVIGNHAIDTMSPGYRHTCLSTQDDLIAYCWGANDLGQFSGVPGPDQPLPSPELALDGVPFSMRQAEHGCGLYPGKIRCWGSNDSGQLGNGKIENYGPASDVKFTP